MDKSAQFLQFPQLIQDKKVKELETIGFDLFRKIGLNCFNNLAQVRLNDITSGYGDSDHFEFDYIIPENQICLIGEITGRNSEKDIREKYHTFIQHINILKKLDFLSSAILDKFRIPSDKIRLFRKVTKLKGFFITITKD